MLPPHSRERAALVSLCCCGQAYAPVHRPGHHSGRECAGAKPKPRVLVISPGEHIERMRSASTTVQTLPGETLNWHLRKRFQTWCDLTLNLLAGRHAPRGTPLRNLNRNCFALWPTWSEGTHAVLASFTHHQPTCRDYNLLGSRSYPGAEQLRWPGVNVPAIRPA